MSYLKTAVSPKATSQREKIPGQEDRQVVNSAGGVSYGVDDFTRLHRFLILGTEGGSYYAGEQKLTKENLKAILGCIKADGLRTVRVIVDVSKDGRAPKNDPAIFALAAASVHGDEATRKAAYEAVPQVCRIGTHIFQYAEFRELFGGWSRGSRRAVANWYTERELDSLAYQIVKYRQRGGWTHRDMLRLAHPKASSPEQNALLRWAAGKGEWTGQTNPKLDGIEMPRIVHGYMAAQAAESPKVSAALVREFRLPREALLTDHLKDPEVWEAMLDAGMPMTAMIRNLATMTRIGLLTTTSEATKKVIGQITDPTVLAKARIHPIAVLIAMRTYAAGHGLRGSNTWTPLPRVIDALDEAYYASFGNIEATGKRRLIALDISGSMWGGNVAGVPGFTPAEASGAMAMVSMKTGDPYEVVAFASAHRSYYGYGSRSRPVTSINEVHDGLISMTLSPRQRLDDVNRSMQDVSRYMGGTDCALPMLYAKAQNKEFDVFEIYTDSETWAGTPHPSQALVDYRKSSGIDAKLVVVGMVSNGFSIADPADGGMLDVVGFDTATPNLISAFVEGGF